VHPNVNLFECTKVGNHLGHGRSIRQKKVLEELFKAVYFYKKLTDRKKLHANVHRKWVVVLETCSLLGPEIYGNIYCVLYTLAVYDTVF